MGETQTTATPAATSAGLTREDIKAIVGDAIKEAVKPLQQENAALRQEISGIKQTPGIKAEDVAKLVTDGITAAQTAQQTAAAAQTKRNEAIATKLKNVPAVYAAKLGTDETKWDTEAAAIRKQYQDDLAAAGVKAGDVTTTAGAAATQGATQVSDMVDLSKLTGEELIDMAVKQSSAARTDATQTQAAAQTATTTQAATAQTTQTEATAAK